MARRRCSVPRCIRYVPKALEFCTEHWKMIPPSLACKFLTVTLTPSTEDISSALQAIERETARRAAFHPHQ